MIYTYLNAEGANHPRTEVLVKNLVAESVQTNNPLIAFTSMSPEVFKLPNGEFPETVLNFQVKNFDELYYVVKSASEKSVVVCSIVDQLSKLDEFIMTALPRMYKSLCDLATTKNIDLYIFSRRDEGRLLLLSDFVQNLETGAILKNRRTAVRPF